MLHEDVVGGDSRLAWRGSFVGLAEERSGDLPLESARFVVVDLETTGLRPGESQICEIGAVRVEGLVGTGTFETLVDPGVPLPPLVSALTGIADRDLFAAPGAVDAVRRFLAFAGDAVLVAHNARFDLAFLDREVERLTGRRRAVVGSGRTDTGVHATGQVVHFDSPVERPDSAWSRGVNTFLPDDVSIRWACPVGDSFHARYSALEKTYVYRIVNGPVISPFWVRYAHQEARPLDLERMKQDAELFRVKHDWTAFSAAQSDVEDRVRTIFDAHWERTPAEWVFRVQGSGFLQYMVRTIVGTLLYVGQGKLKPDDIPKILEARDRKLAGPSAPAHGLHLISVEY